MTPLAAHTARLICPNLTTNRRPLYSWKALILRGSALCPEMIISDTAISTSVPCSARHDTSYLGFDGPEPCSLPKYVNRLRDEEAKGWILEGKLLILMI
jgi:hypothetical protein